MKSIAVVKRIMASDADSQKKFKMRVIGSAHHNKAEIADIA
jgi:hypothetical protein